MADQVQISIEGVDATKSAEAAGASIDGLPAQESASLSRGLGMRIKNLDTGEEFDLEDYDARAPTISGRHSGSGDADQPGAIEEDEEQPDRGVGGKKKAWLKSTKKLKSWARTTLTNVKEKIEERIEKQQLQRHHHQQQKQLQQQQQQQQQHKGLGTWSGGGGEEALDGAALSSAFHEPLEHGSVESRPEPGLVTFLDPTSAGGGFEGAVESRSSLGQGSSLEAGGSLASTSTSTTAAAAAAMAAAAATTAVASNSNSKKLAAAGRNSTLPPTGKATRGSSTGDGDGSVGGRSSSCRHTESSTCPPPSSSGGLTAVASVPEPNRGSAALKSGGGTATGTRLHIPMLPPLRGFLAQQPLGAAVATAATAATTTASAAAGPATGSGSMAGPTPFIALGERGGAVQCSGDLRIPLLEEDLAGPSSRAVPTPKSWLNQPARVAGGRRAAGRQLQQMRMIQELLGHDGPVWAMKFSSDARLLATAGRDGVLRVWSVYWYAAGRSKLISPARDDTGHATAPHGGPSVVAHGSAAAAVPVSATAAAATASCSGSGTRPPLLSESPLLCLPGHRSDVLDLSWSQCRLVLTASADQTARLWCIDVPVGSAKTAGGSGGYGLRKPGGGSGSGSGSGTGAEGSFSEGLGPGGSTCPSGECLRSFVHPDFVTSCCFHPSDPRRIVTGCADGKIRVWSVPDASVVTYATVPQDLITRVLFSDDGIRVVAGTLRGKARYYEFSGGALEYLTQLDVKNPHGSGRKVTGLAQVPYTYGNDQLYVITSADSRIRLYVGYTQERKFKGHRHTNTQISASLSPSCQHLICGSDDGWVYVWETGLPPPPLSGSSGTGAAVAAAAAAVAAGVPGVTAAASTTASATAAVMLQGHGQGQPLGSARNTRAVGANSKEGAAAGVSVTGARGAGGKVKEGTFEAFQTPEHTTTVAIIAPNVCRLGRGLDRQGTAAVVVGMAPASVLDNGEGTARPQLPLLGALFVVTGFSGKIYVYENLPVQWTT